MNRPSTEEMVADLEAGGWAKASERSWRSPVGTLFPGPYGAWLVLRLYGPSQAEVDAVLAQIEIDCVCHPAEPI